MIKYNILKTQSTQKKTQGNRKNNDRPE